MNRDGEKRRKKTHYSQSRVFKGEHQNDSRLVYGATQARLYQE